MEQRILRVVHILLQSTNAVGCDSTATLNLTINNSSSSEENVTACDSFDWNGVTYTEMWYLYFCILLMLVVVILQLL